MSQVVVVGGGMAGVACAMELGDKGIEVLLVDRNDYLQFQPLLYQVASSQLPAEDVARPLSEVFADHPTVAVVRSSVTAIDFGTRRVTTESGTFGGVDYLVLAAGAQAELLRRHRRRRTFVPAVFRRRCRTAPPAPARSAAGALRTRAPPPEPLNVVIVGGGPTGVETAGAIAELFNALRADGRLGEPGLGAPGRPRQGVAESVLRQVPRVRAGEADRPRRQGHLRRRRHQGRTRNGRAVRRFHPADPNGDLGWRRVGIRRSPASTGATPGRGGRIDVDAGPFGARLRRRLRGRRRRQHPGSRRPRVTAAGFGRPAVREVGGQATSVGADQRPARPRRSTTTTRASWR